MNKKMLCRVILTPVTKREDGVMEGGFVSLNGVEFVGELQPRNGECTNGTCPNAECKHGSCTNEECKHGNCTNGECKHGNCLNSECTNGNCTTPTPTPTSTSTATGTSKKIGSLALDGLI